MLYKPLECLADQNDLLISSVISSFIPQLLSTADEVEKLQEELETMQPLLAQAAEETVETMGKIKVDSVGTHLFHSLVYPDFFEQRRVAGYCTL